MQVITNGGSMIFTQKGKMKMLPLELHYNQNLIATILSFKIVANLPGVRVVYDSDKEDVIHVILPNKFVLSFKPCKDGLYYLDSTKINITQPLNNPRFTLLSTVAHNKVYFSEREIQGANAAHQLQEDLAIKSKRLNITKGGQFKTFSSQASH